MPIGSRSHPLPRVRPAVAVVAILLVAGVTAGCSRRPESLPRGMTSEATDARQGEATRSGTPPTGRDPTFVPPSWKALEGAATWIDRPVRDSLQALRDELAAEPPLAPVAEALAMRNDSTAANALILSALGQLPGEGEADPDARLVRHLRADIGSTNPIMRDTQAEFDILGLTDFGLFSFDRRMEPFATAETVASWQTSADGLADKVVIRDDLSWSDGRPITAHDVAFSYGVIMDDDVRVPSVRGGTDQLRGVHAYDERTVVFFHRERMATNPWNLNFPIIPRHAYEPGWRDDPTLRTSPAHRALEENPVCGGPYKIVEWKRGERIVLRRREEWSTVDGRRVRDVPFFREICFLIIDDPARALAALREGEIDEMPLTPEQWQATDDAFYEHCTKVAAPEWTAAFFAWNIRSPLFADRRVRRAMTYAFDHQRMLGDLCHGLYQPSTGPFHESSWVVPRKRQAPANQDLDRAQQLLDESGWTDSDSDGVRDREIDGRLVPFEFTMLVHDQPLRVRTCELLRDDLARIGVRMSVLPMEHSLLVDRTQARRFEAWHGGWGAAADPDATESAWKTGGLRNLVGYSNPQLDLLYDEGRRELDRTKRGERYARIQELLWEDQPVTWLYWRAGLHAFSKEIRGYVFSPRGPFNFSPGARSLWRPLPAAADGSE